MASAAADLAYLRAGVPELKDYLLSDHLFWPLTGSLPRLTVGGLLIAQARSNAWRLSAAQQSELTRLEARLKKVQSRWRSSWERKANWEYGSRLNQWRNYLEDYRGDRAGHTAYYPQEVKLRVMVELLETQIATSKDSKLRASLDSLLRKVFIAGTFVWESELENGFPQSPYWYLYGGLADRQR